MTRMPRSSSAGSVLMLAPCGRQPKTHCDAAARAAGRRRTAPAQVDAAGQARVRLGDERRAFLPRGDGDDLGVRDAAAGS